MINFTLASDFWLQKSAKICEPWLFSTSGHKNKLHVANHFSAVLI